MRTPGLISRRAYSTRWDQRVSIEEVWDTAVEGCPVVTSTPRRVEILRCYTQLAFSYLPQDLIVEPEPNEARSRVYTLDRYSRRGLMAEGAKVHAASDAEAIEKAHRLFREYPDDVFKIVRVSDHECPYPEMPCICGSAHGM